MVKLTKSVARFRIAYRKALAAKWKGGSNSVSIHLQRRIKRGHLSPNATAKELIEKGLQTLRSPEAVVYEYIPVQSVYFIVHDEWAVFFDQAGLWDTAFPPDVPEKYFSSGKGYRKLGKLKELIQ